MHSSPSMMDMAVRDLAHYCNNTLRDSQQGMAMSFQNLLPTIFTRSLSKDSHITRNSTKRLCEKRSYPQIMLAGRVRSHKFLNCDLELILSRTIH